MRVFSAIAYIFSALCLYAGLAMSWGGSFNLMYIWDISAFLFIIAGLVLTIINFKFSEIAGAVKRALLVSAVSFEKLTQDKNALQAVWKFLVWVTVVNVIAIMVIILSNLDDTTKIGPSLAVMSILPLYTLTLRFFILMPLEISLEKKIIQFKQQKNPQQVV
jgi:hypothetical protein